MRVSLRILLGYFMIVGLAAWFVMNIFIEEVKPGVRQAMEDTLVDTANLLATLAQADLQNGQIQTGAFAQAVAAYQARETKIELWGIPRRDAQYRIYITNAQGTVVFDSEHRDVGADFSRWNDVYMTLQGKYGARTTQQDPGNPLSTMMFVAAPIKVNETLIGVLTVAKSNLAVQPFVERAQRKILRNGRWLLGASMLIGLAFSYWLSWSIGRLRQYARAVTEGNVAEQPRSMVGELNELGAALHNMREKLEGKAYVEEYVHALTHELKSPLSAIQGAAELLEDPDMRTPDRIRFLNNIQTQTTRMQHITDRMLNLADIEHRQRLTQTTQIDMDALLQTTLQKLAPRLLRKRIEVRVSGKAGTLEGEAFLLEQALTNLLENAIDFSPEQSTLMLNGQHDASFCIVTLQDAGAGIPEYALQRVFERFYSLPRPDTQTRSTGLGLPFVRQVAILHKGSITLTNHPQGGAIARLQLARFPTRSAPDQAAERKPPLH